MLGSMLFNLGLTADAAAAHRHEFSPQTEEKPEEKRLRSSRALSALPTITMSSPFAASTSKTLDDSMSDSKEPPHLSTKSSHPSSLYSSSDNDDDEDVSSVVSPTRPSIIVSKRSARSKTTFQLAHPPGNPRHIRLRLRPKLLLQLQQIGPASRPVPAFDVLPAAISPRLACKFPKLFGAIHKLGPRDLIVLTSDSYEQPNSGEDDRSVSSEEYSQEHREVVATICQPVKDDSVRKCKVEIYLGSRVSWEGTSMPNGSYEFISRGEQETRKARWVLRKSRRSGTGVSDFGEASKRFTFSMINPNTRRHPVIASMTRSSIDVYEQYSLPPVSPSEEVLSPVSLAGSEGGNGETGRELINMEDDLRTLIVVTGVWIAFMEGWSKNFSYDYDTSPRSDSPVNTPVSPKRKSSTVSKQEKETAAADGQRRRNPIFSVVESSMRPSLSINRSRSQTLPSSRRFQTVVAGDSSSSATPDTSQRKRANSRCVSASYSSQTGAIDRQDRVQDLPSRLASSSDLKWTDLSENGHVTNPDPQDDRQHQHHHNETAPANRRRPYSHVPLSHREIPNDSPNAPDGDKDRDRDTRTKGKRWHRLSAIFGKKKH
ncbi:hypothetical protein VTN77DRAFT_6109 [Rasamsonia byssochlamydoides]|uniref:uncharacterized protein n=1 Tax=Rasamsonia byssochlamydoides TaxID=89139 RepID=UPI003743F20A